MKKLVLLILVATVLITSNNSFGQIKNFKPSKIDRAWEVSFIQNTSKVDGFQNSYGFVNTGYF